MKFVIYDLSVFAALEKPGEVKISILTNKQAKDINKWCSGVY